VAIVLPDFRTQEKVMTETQVPCPQWAVKKIEKLREIEIRSGNLVEDQTVAGYHSQLTDRLSAAMDSSMDDSLLAEAIFGEICRGLVADGFDDSQITNFINARLTGGSKLPYCDVGEVQASLASNRK
jgi:hypothetical protein